MPTIKEVAERAAVSPATVSRVLNDRATVDPSLVRRVRRAIDELGYQPSRTARALRTGSRVWTLIISDIRNVFFGEVARGVEDAAQDANLALVLCNTDEDLGKERAYLELAAVERVAGVILSPASWAETSVDRLRAAGIPVVLVDREIMADGVDTVTIDNRASARAATQHLLARGYQRIGCISGPPTVTTARDRRDGYRDALQDASLRVDAELIREEGFKMDGGERGAAALLELAEPPDALFVANGPQCAGALRVLRERGVQVPTSMGLISFDDEPWTSLTTPAISTVAQPAYALGREAAALLHQRMSGDDGPPRRVLLNATLQIRSSSSPE
jgi:LacI family transcriptional regulator, galactose operon repressor